MNMEVSEEMSESTEDFMPRNYQVELMRIALQQNTILYLPTGAGKTYIAILVLKQLSEPLLKPWAEGGKISVILVNTVMLVYQHAEYLRRHTNFRVGAYSGDLNVDFWNHAVWNEECNKHQVLVMTCQILTNAVEKTFISLNRINLLVFDECHRGVEDHAMRQLMKSFQHVTEKPRVLGLTATLLNGNCKPSKVQSEVYSLETTYHSKVATVDELGDVIGYSTNPQEKIVSYPPYNVSQIEQDVLMNFERVKNLLQLVQLEENTTAKKENLIPFCVKDSLKELRNLIDDAIYHIRIFGIFGGIKTLLAHTIQIERMKRHCEDKKMFNILNAVITEFTYAKSLLKKQMTGDEKVDVIKFSSPKVQLLFNIIHEYKTLCQEDLCAIIFVQRRFTAKVLYHILRSLSQSNEEFSYINPEFMIGFNNLPSDTTEGLYLKKINKDIIQKFYSKEINMISASNVLEEGIDVPKCSLVVKFDAPLDYRSYIQSKGRARHKNSLYYVMTETNEYLKFMDKYQTYQLVEQELNKFLIGQNEYRQSPSALIIKVALYEEHDLPPYYVNGPGSAQVNVVSACSLLNQYCSRLPVDMYTTYVPNWYLESDLYSARCRVIIDLPIVCPIRNSIAGPYMAKKKEAKRAAALQACIMLHKIGELDDNLKPVKKSELEENVNVLFSHWPSEPEKDAGNKNKRRIHPINIPRVCIGELRKNKVYLHVIHLTPKFESNQLDINWSFMSLMYTTILSFGIISPNQFPALCEFPIYVSPGEISVEIKENARILVLQEDEYKNIQEFNYLIYNNVLGILKEYLVFNNGEDGAKLMLVPLQKDNYDIDYEVIKENKRLVDKSLVPTSEEKKKLRVDDDGYLGKIVTPWYRPDDTDYFVTEVCNDMNAYSSFPTGNHDTYYDYFKSMYRITILNPQQPLLRVKALSSQLNCLKPRGTAGKRKDILYEEYEIHFVAEMVVKQDFPAELWIQAKLLPSIFDKLFHLLRAEELRCKIASEAQLGVVMPSFAWQPLLLDLHLLNYETECKKKNVEQLEEHQGHLKMKDVSSILNKLSSDVATKKLNAEFPWDKKEEPIDIQRNLEVTVMDVQYYENFLCKRVRLEDCISRADTHQWRLPAITYGMNFVEKSISILDKSCVGGPELAEIYKALTTAKAADIVNLERLETLGDSFLKWISSTYIVLRYPNYDEGRATALKGRLVSNKNLYYLAAKKKLGGYLKLNDLKPKDEWSPPCYCLPTVLKQFVESVKIANNTLLNLNIPSQEQISGELSPNTERSILVEVRNEDQDMDECDSTLNYYTGYRCVSDKVVADAVESLLGAYLESCGIKGGLKLIEWLEIIPKSENLTDLLDIPSPDPKLNPHATLSNIDYHIPAYEDIEKRLDYKFKNRAYLLQAFTHSSYTPNRITLCYQRLEFLGDAVLDFLITCHIYESCGYLKPGDLTDLRSALVNNVTFACYTVRHGFHKFLLAINSQLQGYIDKFVMFQENKDFAINDDVLILLNENDIHLSENIDVPKVLGDLFEALAGAVFLDSGKDLKTVWKVFYKIMWNEIENFSKNVPKNAVRVLHEKIGAHPLFHKAVGLDNSSKIMVKLDFMNAGTLMRVHGFGDNKIVAKKAAAKMALRLLDS